MIEGSFRLICHKAQNCLFYLSYSNKREPKNQELQFVHDVWEHTISGSLDGPYTITRCSEETLQFVPKEQPVKGKIRSLLSNKKSA